MFGESHEKTKGKNKTNSNQQIANPCSESTDFLKLLTQQAVSLQKTMNAMKNKDNVKGNLPLPMQPPDRAS